MKTPNCSPLLAALLVLGISTTAIAEESNDPIHDAVQIMYDTDYNGRTFTLVLGYVGALEGMGWGSWAMWDRPLGTSGAAAVGHFASSVLMAGTGFMQIMHGLLRFEERTVSASTARKLLDNPELMKSSGRLYLEHRARESQTTRFWGAIMTTAQGLAATSAGLHLLIAGDGEYNVRGGIVTGIGAAITAIGAIHFFGEPKAERVRAEALDGASTSAALDLGIGPALLPDGHNGVTPGLMVSGTF